MSRKFAQYAACLTSAMGATLLPAVAAGAEGTQVAALLDSKHPIETVVVTGEHVEGYDAKKSRSSTRTDTPLLDTPQSVTVVTQDLIKDRAVRSIGDAIIYVPGVTLHQGENNRDQVVIRGNSSSADFFIDGARDDVQYFRDLYNIENVEVLKGPNAMAFGRGGSGGLVNRVTKMADGNEAREIIVSGGSFDAKRVQADLDQPVDDALALRLNTVYEHSGTFRQFGDLERYGVNPTASLLLDEGTRLQTGYEYFHDERFNDRGIPSQNGGPFRTDPATFFGDPKENTSRANVQSGFAILSRDFGADLKLRNYVRYADYDKFYQNVYAGSAVSAAGTLSIVGYNNFIHRSNFTDQADLTGRFATGPFDHSFLIGAEISTQASQAFRETGFFNNTTTSVTVSAAHPITLVPITYRQSPSDADNRSNVHVWAGYAQDQVALTPWLELTAGLRFDRFGLSFHDNRSGRTFARTDDLVSPRLGLVAKPVPEASIYASYSVSFLPSAGDQFSTLTAQTQGLKPEKLQNYEIGAKWDILPDLDATFAVYQLDRTNTRAVDPADPTRFVLTGSARTQGVELGVAGKVTPEWQVSGGIGIQDAVITSTTSAAPAGKNVALVPHMTATLWNRYDITPAWGAGLGIIHQSSQFAAVDNAVRLPGFTRLDAAIYVRLDTNWRLQLNVENLLDRRYYLTADSNNNISPGSPRAFNAALTADL
jgi:catecholate siderophore receptor